MALVAAHASICWAGTCGVCRREAKEEWRYCPYCASTLAGFREGKDDAGKLLIGIEGPASKVYRDPRSFKGRRGGDATVKLARGEYEPVQLVLYPVPVGKGAERRTFTWDVTDLTGPRGRMDRGSVSISPVGYVQPKPEHYGQDYAGAHPDPLSPSAERGQHAVSAAVGELQPLWVLVHAPPGTPAGDYAGTITIREGPQTVATVGLRTHVWDFTLPDEMHLPAAFDFYDIRPSYPRGEGESAEAWGQRIASIERAYYTDMLRHRISPIRNLGYPRFIGVEKGVFRFDFSDFDRNHDLYVGQMHQPRFALAPEWPGWGTSDFERWKPDKWIGFRSPTALKETFRAIGEHCQSRGWLDKAYIYSIDEHPGEWTRKICALIHEGHPRIKNLLTIMVQEGYPDTDIWCPRMYELTPDRLELGRKFQRAGKELWVYTSGPRPPFPTLMLDWDLINCRIIPWMCWKFDLDGYLYWCINYWKGSPWENPAPYPRQNGNGFLYYPGRDGPVGSLRLEALRDGLEDYEYLWLLRDRVRQCREKGVAAEKVAEAEGLLQIGDAVVSYFDKFTYDPRLVYNMRERVAMQIEILNGLRGEVR